MKYNTLLKIIKEYLRNIGKYSEENNDIFGINDTGILEQEVDEDLNPIKTIHRTPGSDICTIIKKDKLNRFEKKYLYPAKRDSKGRLIIKIEKASS